MKTVRFRIIALAVLVLVLAVWLFRPPRGQTPKTDGATETGNVPARQEPSTEPGATARISADQRERVPPPSATTTNPATEEPDKTVQLQAAATAKNVPVNFWGKVVDQDEQPLSGVRVVMRVRQWFYNPNSGPGTLSPKQERTTDAEGRFEWTGASGDSLELESVTKEGYRLSPKAQSGFIYRRDGDSFQPVAANPVVIRMWKLTASEALVSFRTLFGFVPDGRGYTMDLLTNKKLDGEKPEGDLVVRMTRPATVEPRQKYDWTLELDGVNGGLVEPADEFGYVAPEAGYQSKVSIRLRASDTDWVDSLTRDFFIRSRGGALYGLLHLSIRSEYDGKSAILFETRLNPQGSRNLQP